MLHYHYRLITVSHRLVDSAVRKTGHFTHVRANLRGDVNEKRFSTHVGEGTWLESERAGVEMRKGWKVSRESDGKRVG